MYGLECEECTPTGCTRCQNEYYVATSGLCGTTYAEACSNWDPLCYKCDQNGCLECISPYDVTVICGTLYTDSPGSIGFASLRYSALETDKSVEISLIRTQGSQGKVAVDYYTEDVTALSISLDSTHAVDYERSTGTVYFNTGQLTASFHIAIYPNPFSTTDEAIFRIVLVNATNGATLYADRTESIPSKYVSEGGWEWWSYCEVEIFHDSRLIPPSDTEVTYNNFLHAPETLYFPHSYNTDTYQVTIKLNTQAATPLNALFLLEARKTVEVRTVSEYSLASFSSLLFDSNPILTYQFISSESSPTSHVINYKLLKQGLYTLKVGCR